MEREGLLRLREVLDALSDDDLRALVGDAPSHGSWAWSGPAQVDGTTVFVKRIPVTAREAEVWPSTRNLFDLPLAYQYGVGSAGFGAAREVEAHRTVSDWVLAGETDAFTVLLHTRLLRREHPPWEMPLDRERYLAMWGGDTRIAAFMDARSAADHEVWMVSEHVPHELARWLPRHQDRLDAVLAALLGAAELMRARGMVHFDAHFANAVVDDDGARVCLVDHGLAMLDSFELGTAERGFLARHRHFDAGEIFVGAAMVARSLEDDDDLALDPSFAARMEQHRPVVELMGGFFGALAADPDKRAVFDDDELVERLRASGVAV